jgi:hypothetical protein
MMKNPLDRLRWVVSLPPAQPGGSSLRLPIYHEETANDCTTTRTIRICDGPYEYCRMSTAVLRATRRPISCRPLDEIRN